MNDIPEEIQALAAAAVLTEIGVDTPEKIEAFEDQASEIAKATVRFLRDQTEGASEDGDQMYELALAAFTADLLAYCFKENMQDALKKRMAERVLEAIMSGLSD